MKTYEEKEILKNAYIDLIHYAGEEGIHIRLKANDILPIIAAPYTQFSSASLTNECKRKIASELRLYILVANRSFANTPRESIIEILEREWVNSLPKEKIEEIALNLSIIESIDANGYVIFKESIWNFYEEKSKLPYREIEYCSVETKKKYDFRTEPNVYEIGGKRIRIWMLNTEYRDERNMMSKDEVVIFNVYPATRKIHTYPTFDKYFDAYFQDKNADEYYADWDHYITTDLRCHAYWRFCKVVKESDIIYLARGSEVYGYCVITGSKVESSMEGNSHKWDCKWTKFRHSFIVNALHPTPFFTYVDHDKVNRIKDAGAGFDE